ncbi:hypothetical protein HY491_02410 [Candidatus Woesearchaeota archaeon]|nr:hypothetical protein [Candidatus Woesearchaeota archaeon]
MGHTIDNGNGAGNRAEHSEQSAFRTPLVVLSDAARAIERMRIMAQVRLKHLQRRGNACSYTAELLARAQALETWVDKTLADLVHHHPAAPWFSRVKGTGGEAIGKVLGYIQAFGRFYPPGDKMIPGYVAREPVAVLMPADGNPDKLEERQMVWVEGIERFTTPSKLRKYAGLVPEQQRAAGRISSFNTDLRVMLFRLGVSLLRANGKYAGFYGEYKSRLSGREGIKVIPTPKGRWCPSCGESKSVKNARHCPDCGSELSLKTEPEGVMYQGHLHLMAHRRMMQLFLDHLWVVWRGALALPLRDPYPIEYLGHSRFILPWDMVDK